MQVKEIIKILKEEYEPDDSLVVGWYDYDEFEGIVKKEQWGEVVDLAELFALLYTPLLPTMQAVFVPLPTHAPIVSEPVLLDAATSAYEPIRMLYEPVVS